MRDLRLYFYSEGSCLRNFIAFKIPLSSARFEPANLGPSDSHTTIRPPRATSFTFLIAFIHTGCLWRCRQYVSPKLWYLPTSPYGVRTQESNNDSVHVKFTFRKDSHSKCCLNLWNALESERLPHLATRNSWPDSSQLMSEGQRQGWMAEREQREGWLPRETDGQACWDIQPGPGVDITELGSRLHL
jgi:hypothetical protein